MKKKLLRILAIMLLLVAGALAGLRTWVSGWVNRGQLITEMEKGWNCRADIASVSLSLFRSPALVEIHGLRLAPRSDEVAKPLDTRAPINPAEVLLSAGTIDLTISLGDLIYRRAVIQRLHVEDFSLRDEEDVVAGGRDGDTHEGLLDLLFARPDDFEDEEEPPPALKPKDNASAAARRGGILSSANVAVNPEPPAVSSAPVEEGQQARASVHKRKRRLKKEHEHKPFKASDLRIALEAQEVSVGNAHIDLLERRTELDKKGNVEERRERRTVFDHVHVALKDLDVAPDDLRNHNRCSLELGGSIELDQKITAEDQPPLARKLVRFEVSGAGFIRPFEEGTGEWNPDFTIQARVRKGALLGGVPLKEALRGKDIKKLADWGMELGDVSLGGIIGDDATADVHYFRGGKLIVKGDTRLVFPDYEITLREGAWFNTHEDTHKARCVLILSPEFSERVLAQAKAYVIKRYGDLAGDAAEWAIKKSPLMTKEKQLAYWFVSKDRLSKPVQEWDAEQLLDVKDLLKDAGTNFLKGLLDK